MGANGFRPATVWLLGALAATGAFSLDMYLPAFPEMAADLHTTPSRIQLTLTACMLGLGFGQVIVGPISDGIGRRRPLLWGLTAYAAASIGCAVAPDLWTLMAARLVQGLAAASAVVLARAILRDRLVGPALLRMLSILIMVLGAGPVLAPIIGAQLLRVTDWRGVMLALGGAALLLAATVALSLPETLAPGLRRRPRLSKQLLQMRAVVSDRQARLAVLTIACAAGAMFSYLSGSSFVLQDVEGLTPQQFSIDFAVNGLGLALAAGATPRLTRRTSTRFALRTGVLTIALGALLLLVAARAGNGRIGMTVAGFFLITIGYGVVSPNAAALTMTGHPERAGAASAAFGLAQYGSGAAVAPLAAWGGASLLRLAVVAAVCSSLGILVMSLRQWREPSAPQRPNVVPSDEAWRAARPEAPGGAPRSRSL